MRHTNEWYQNAHDILAGMLIIVGLPVLIIICSLLEGI